ncbi:MAG TPA: lasso peptide biosynthesis B2 protein [Steroidobacteraceae bacterium]|nr:lasso peptide biosynthesis B2 protein [Steroidobacteraceae bacterium]
MVLLDLRHDRYFGVTRRDDALLVDAVREWPALPGNVRIDDGATPAEFERIMGTLLEQQVLVPEETRDVRLASRTLDLMQDLVSIGDEIRPAAAIRAHHVWNFLVAHATARRWLKRRPILRIAQDIRDTRLNRREQYEDFDLEHASVLVAVFRRLRPYLFAAKGQCLLHALTLALFLRRYGVFATWAFGVKTAPWDAHSWVQEGPYLLDTNPEKVCEYTPILGV